MRSRRGAPSRAGMAVGGVAPRYALWCAVVRPRIRSMRMNKPENKHELHVVEQTRKSVPRSWVGHPPRSACVCHGGRRTQASLLRTLGPAGVRRGGGHAHVRGSSSRLKAAAQAAVRAAAAAILCGAANRIHNHKRVCPLVTRLRGLVTSLPACDKHSQARPLAQAGTIPHKRVCDPHKQKSCLRQAPLEFY